MKWIHFLFNKINKKLELTTQTFYESLEEYYKHYKPTEIINKEVIKGKKNVYVAAPFYVEIIGIRE